MTTNKEVQFKEVTCQHNKFRIVVGLTRCQSSFEIGAEQHWLKSGHSVQNETFLLVSFSQTDVVLLDLEVRADGLLIFHRT